MDSPIGKVVVSAVYEGGAAERHGEWGPAAPRCGDDTFLLVSAASLHHLVTDFQEQLSVPGTEIRWGPPGKQTGDHLEWADGCWRDALPLGSIHPTACPIPGGMGWCRDL